MFAFNNMAQQQAIAAEGGIRFSCFMDFLQSDDEYFRCNAAFQVGVVRRHSCFCGNGLFEISNKIVSTELLPS